MFTCTNHSKFSKAAVFDIISPDQTGPVAAGSEIILLVNYCLDSFPEPRDSYFAFERSVRYVKTVILVDVAH